MKKTPVEMRSLNASLEEILALCQKDQVDKEEANRKAEQSQELQKIRDLALARLRTSQKIEEERACARETELLDRIRVARKEGQQIGAWFLDKQEKLEQLNTSEREARFELEADVLVVERGLSRQRWGKSLAALTAVGLMLVTVFSVSTYRRAIESEALDVNARAELAHVLNDGEQRRAQVLVANENYSVLARLSEAELRAELKDAKAEARLALKAEQSRAAQRKTRQLPLKASKASKSHHGAGSVLPLHSKAIETTAAVSMGSQAFDCLPGDPMCMSF